MGVGVKPARGDGGDCSQTLVNRNLSFQMAELEARAPTEHVPEGVEERKSSWEPGDTVSKAQSTDTLQSGELPSRPTITVHELAAILFGLRASLCSLQQVSMPALRTDNECVFC